jgi:putative flippase GtrA
MTTVRRSSLGEYLRGSWRILLKELSAFGFIGALAFVTDVGLFAALSTYGALKAKFVSTLVSTTLAYFGNRYLSFSHRARTSIGRETSFFFGINLITLVFSECAIGVTVYGLGYGHTSTTVFVVNLVSIVLGTMFRFWAYKRFVFLHPDRVHEHHVDLAEELAE